MFSSSRKRGGADAFENDPSFRSKGTVPQTVEYIFKFNKSLVAPYTPGLRLDILKIH
jgi:hypothetical protein